MKKIITMLMAITLVGGTFTGCSDEKEQSSENSKGNSSVGDPSKSDENDDSQNTESATDEKTDAYTGSCGFSLCDEELIAPYQGSIIDIAMGFNVLCLTDDEMVISFDEDMESIAAPGGVRFVDCVGGGVVVERADGTCMCFDDSFSMISMREEGFKMQDGSYFECFDGMQYIVSDGEKLVGYKYDYNMELIASEVPVIINPYDMSGDENPLTPAGDWFTSDYNSFLLLDTNHQVWDPWSPTILQLDYNEDDNRIEIDTFNDPVITDCSMLCLAPKYDELIIAKASDTSNLYLLTEGDEGYAESMTIALPDGLTTADIKEFVANSDDGVFITNDNEIYSIDMDGDVYEISAQPELSQMLQEGKIVKIVGNGYYTLFLMDDGCVYEKSSF